MAQAVFTYLPNLHIAGFRIERLNVGIWVEIAPNKINFSFADEFDDELLHLGLIAD